MIWVFDLYFFNHPNNYKNQISTFIYLFIDLFISSEML